MKVCTKCGIEKPHSEFYRQTSQRTGLSPACKVCVNSYNDAYEKRNVERMRQWHRESALRQWAKRNLGIDRDVYDALLARANGRCEVCGRSEQTTSRTGKVYTLALDHDHATMQVRGLLCRPCNTALGCAQDDPRLLRKLAHYLEHPLGAPKAQAELPEYESARRSPFPHRKPGWTHSPETRAKIAATAVGNQRTAGLKHPPRSAEWLEKQSAAQKLAWQRRRSRSG